MYLLGCYTLKMQFSAFSYECEHHQAGKQRTPILMTKLQLRLSLLLQWKMIVSKLTNRFGSNAPKLTT